MSTDQNEAVRILAGHCSYMGYGMFALAQPITLDELALQTGTARTTGRQVAARAARPSGGEQVIVDATETAGPRLANPGPRLAADGPSLAEQ